MASEFINIHEVLERVRHLAEAESPGDVKILRDYDPSIPDIFADRELLIQATLNVVRNAVQALREGNVNDGVIRLRSRTLRQYTIGAVRHKLVCQVEIIDNGPGIDPMLMDSLFFPMVSGRAEGTGLGLSFAQSIISRHQGLIECASEPGNTVFSLNIPFLTEQQGT
jgi:two-component system nitrogen regulation sensor histidine kinase GlnL